MADGGMNATTQYRLADHAIAALELLAKNLGRLAIAVEQANALAEKHQQWERREDAPA